MTRFEFALQVLESGADLHNVSFYWDHWQDLTRTPPLVTQPVAQSKSQIEEIVHQPLRSLWGRAASPVSLFKDNFEGRELVSAIPLAADRRHVR